jgi:hypothetical protein
VRWAMLPEATQQTVTALMIRLLVDHSGSAASTDRPETCDAD